MDGRRQRTYLIVLCFGLFLMPGCGGGGGNGEIAPITGTLVVTVEGLPNGVPANISINGPNGFSQVLTTSQTLQVSPGTYSAKANSVAGGSLNYYASNSQQSVAVQAASSASLQVSYDTTISTTTKVLDPTGMQSLTVSSDGSTLTLSSSSSIAAGLSPGDVLVSAPTTATPYGLLRRVATVTQSGTLITVTTTQAALVDAIPSGNFHVSQTVGVQNLRQVTSSVPGLTLKLQKASRRKSRRSADSDTNPCGGGLVIAASGTLTLYPPPGMGTGRASDSGATTEVNISGEAEICANVQVQVDMNWLNLQLQSAKAVATVGGSTGLTIQGIFDGKLDGKLKIGQATLDPITIYAGIAPVVIVPQLTFYLGASGELTAGISTDLSDEVSAQAGFQYANGQPSLIANAQHSFTYDPPAFDVSVTPKAYLETDVALLVYGVVGPLLKPDLFVEAQVDVTANPWWKILGGVEGSVGLEASVFGFQNIGDFSIDIDASLTLTVAQANGPFTLGQAQPQLNSITPTNADAGSPDVPISLSGANFIPGAFVTWNGVPLVTTFADTSDLASVIPAADVTLPGSYSITVENPDLAGATSNILTFTVNNTVVNPVPSITGLSPSSLTAGSAPQSLIISGTGFLSSSSVTFNASAHTPTLVSANQLTIPLTSADLATAGSFPVLVTNPAPGGGASNSVSFVVSPASTGSVTISPASVTVPESAVQTFTATVSGGGSVAWTLQEGAAGGMISSAGIYSVPNMAGTFHVVATNTANSTQTAVSTVTVLVGPSLVTLHSFDHSTDGANPWSGLIQTTDGGFYGTTSVGGNLNCSGFTPNSGCGTIFAMDTSGNTSVLHSFAGAPDGALPVANLIQSTDTNLYGTTLYGGANLSSCEFGGTSILSGCGTVFKTDLSGNLTTLYSFSSFSAPEGVGPQAALVQATDQKLYGNTVVGSSATCMDFLGSAPTTGCGAIFNVDTAGNLTPLHSFAGPEGAYPVVALIQATDGYFYGVTGGGGDQSCSSYAAPGCGTVFKMSSDGTITTLHSFTGQDGAYPDGALLSVADGNLYGTAVFGGNAVCTGGAQWQGCGVIFKIDTTGSLTVLHSFSGVDGAYPNGALLQASDGNLYGTTEGGGNASCAGRYGPGCGTVFKVDRSGNVTVLYSFSGGTDGSWPEAGIIQGKDEDLYGTTLYGGTNDDGVVFRISTFGSSSPQKGVQTVKPTQKSGIPMPNHQHTSTPVPKPPE